MDETLDTECHLTNDLKKVLKTQVNEVYLKFHMHLFVHRVAWMPGQGGVDAWSGWVDAWSREEGGV